MAHGAKPWIVHIPGITKLNRLEKILSVVHRKLSAADLREINAAASKIDIQSERLPESSRKMTGL